MALRRWVPPRQAGVRLLIALAVGGAVGGALYNESLPLRLIAAWNIVALVMLSFAWRVIWAADADETRARAAGEDPGRHAVWVLATLSSTFSLFAAVAVLSKARTLAPGHSWWWAVLCLAAVGSSWLLTHTGWALRYAHLYYRDDSEGVGGLTFPSEAGQSRAPDAFDFAYFAFTIGICFQTSDVCVTSPQIRRAVLFHSCQSFAYTTAILALTLNLAFGMLT
jgi:uncharacterized membrane protein